MNDLNELERAEQLRAENDQLRRELGLPYEAYSVEDLEALRMKTRLTNDNVALAKRLEHTQHIAKGGY